MTTVKPPSAVARLARSGISVALVAALVFAACGDDDDDAPGITNTPAATATAATTAGGDTGTVRVVAQDISFSPTRLTIPAGQQVTIVFTNNDAAVPHNFHILDTGEKTDTFTGEQGPSAELVVRFDEPGEYAFQCDVHPGIMTGTIIVE
ncbi:MAG: hypothetical protein Kow0010_08490 [Dehalococcoidia bacterium]